MASESYFATIDTNQILAGKVVITPANPPADGCAHHSRVARNRAPVFCAVDVVGVTLEISLPPACAIGDKVHWTSYDL